MLLIALFVISELTFVGILLFQLKQAEQEVDKQSHFNEIMKRTQMLVYNLNEYEMSLGAWARDRSAENRAVVDQFQNNMSDCADWLCEQLKSDPELNRKTLLVRDEQNIAFRRVKKMMKRLEKIQDFQQLISVARAWYSATTPQRMQWQLATIDLLKDEEKILNDFPKIGAARRAVITSIVCCGVIGNIILIALLSAAFATGINSRLAVMLANTRRLAEQKALSPLLGGSDELALLDFSMHEMADAIALSQKERQAFLAVVSHELRTPLSAVSTSLELLSMGVVKNVPEHAQKKAADTEAVLANILNLINDLLDLEKLEAGKLSLMKRPVKVSEIIENSFEQLKPFCRMRGVRLRYQLQTADPDVAIPVDLARIVQTLSNLIRNAAQASAQNKAIDVDVSESGESIRIAVSDRGSGVPGYLQSQIFERFRKAESNAAEDIVKGMGLPLARYIVEAHGGSIGYESREGGGSVFWFQLNKVDAPNLELAS
jgi:signal transduction histidine kinase